ncbi:exported hypothetical protein [Cupriavidus necator]|uniref:Uncharacterized protein n=1 Tax=Cupriavidus necator TaxID=106590 RepID=A0A1K0IF13_CUPNE|nr:exported hypothetical protein [Cupriavidus necator]
MTTVFGGFGAGFVSGAGSGAGGVGAGFAAAVLLTTLVVSALMIKAVEIPIDRFRQRRVATLA